MGKIADTIEELIGQTPILRLRRLSAGLDVELLAKLEMFNPSGSYMDRVVLSMLQTAEADGALGPGTTIVEATSGNIAFSLAILAVPRGYRVILVMPDVISSHRVQLLRALGAEVVLTPAAYGMVGAESRADALSRELPSLFRPNQFANPANPAAHRQTADEIWEACEGRLGAVVIGVSTGGTATGLGQRLKELSAGQIRVVAVQPSSSPVLTGGEPGAHRLYGMGAPFIPANYDPHTVDEILSVSNHECQNALVRVARSEGLMTGPTGAAAIAAALRLAQRAQFSGQRLVAIIPDGLERYAQTDIFESTPLLIPTYEGDGT